MNSQLHALFSQIRGGGLTLALIVGLLANLPVTTVAHSQTAPFSSADIGFAEGSGSGTEIAARLPAIQSAASPKAPILRLDLDWWYVEHSPGAALRWDRLDPVVDEAAARGMKVLLVVDPAGPDLGTD
ncbi:hypothetical protein ACFWUP_09380 [Nocardia sp. NPDC058658]|uniref:hypothetical protein n=1 Tax=Nocardia sp. NPDC058658 TaxID=3346580 RepID=UPI00366682AD